MCTGATPGQPTTWTASAFEEQPLLRRAICLAVQEHVQVLVRRISQTHHIELHDVYIRNVRRVTPRKRQPRLRVEFTICMVPDSILRQFAHDGNVFNAAAILETARAHHARAHTEYIRQLKGDHELALCQHRETCARDYSREDAVAGVPAVRVDVGSNISGDDAAESDADSVADDDAPNTIELERAFRAEIRESLPGLTVRACVRLVVRSFARAYARACVRVAP